MKVFLKRLAGLEHSWKVLAVLALIAAIAISFSANVGQILILMANAYIWIGFSSLLNRSSTKNSWVYHGVVLLINSVTGYWVLKSVHGLISATELTYVIAVAYVTATVWGSLTGTRLSIFLEKKLAIKTKSRAANEPPSREEQWTKYALLFILGVVAVITLVVVRSSYLTAILVFTLNFLNVGIHTFLRRSRNEGLTLFHNFGLLAQGLQFFFLLRFLASENMSWVFFLPYAMGGILGGIFAHKVGLLVTNKIKADPDSHLLSDQTKLSLFPWKALTILSAAAVAVVVAITLMSQSLILAGTVFGLALIQYIAFTLISRARPRINRIYEAYTSILSNGTWLATFSKLDQNGWGLTLFLPYIIGVMVGGNVGMGVAMNVERKYQITSDEK